MPVIGFDAQATQGRQTGLGIYTSRLLAALEKGIPPNAYLRIYKRKILPEDDLNTRARLCWENFELPRRAKQDRIDLLHVPAFAPPLCKPCRLVVTVHDIAGMLFPNQIGRASAFYWGKWLPFVIRLADQIISDSEYTKQDLIKHLKIPEKKIHVIYPSGHEMFTADFSEIVVTKVKRQCNIRNQYFLCVGTLEPRKNLIRIFDAFKVFLSKHSEYQLVLAGSREFAYGKYASFLEEKHSLPAGTILTLGFVCHDVLNALYAGAVALLYPSLYEGFGMPILEAMASGCPVLTSHCTSTTEVAGEAAQLVDPCSVDAIAQGMLDLATREALRQDLKKKGFEQIKKFSWEKTARETINIYKKMLGC